MTVQQTIEGVLLGGNPEHSTLYSSKACYECGYSGCRHDEYNNIDYEILDFETRKPRKVYAYEKNPDVEALEKELKRLTEIRRYF